MGAMSTSASKSAMTFVLAQMGVVPSSGSNIGWSCASSNVTEAALASIKASDKGSANFSATVVLICIQAIFAPI